MVLRARVERDRAARAFLRATAASRGLKTTRLAPSLPGEQTGEQRDDFGVNLREPQRTLTDRRSGAVGGSIPLGSTTPFPCGGWTLRGFRLEVGDGLGREQARASQTRGSMYVGSPILRQGQHCHHRCRGRIDRDRDLMLFAIIGSR